MAALEETSRRPSVNDVTTMIALLAALEGEIWSRADDKDEIPDWAEVLAGVFERRGLVPPRAGNRELRRAIGDLNQRLRYVLGEHDDPRRTS